MTDKEIKMNPLLPKHLATYAPEDCATCNGSGRMGIRDPLENSSEIHPSILDDEKAMRFIALYALLESPPECNVCGGRGSILVLQPSHKCPHCAGNGRGLQPRCLQCRGTGWLLAWKER